MAEFSRPITITALCLIALSACADGDPSESDAQSSGTVDEPATMAGPWTLEGSVLNRQIDFNGDVTCEESQAFSGDILCSLAHTYPLESCGVRYEGRLSWSDDLDAWEGQLANMDTETDFYEDVDDITLYMRLTAIGSQTDKLAFYAYFDITNEEASGATLCNAIREDGVTGDLIRNVE